MNNEIKERVAEIESQITAFSLEKYQEEEAYVEIFSLLRQLNDILNSRLNFQSRRTELIDMGYLKLLNAYYDNIADEPLKQVLSDLELFEKIMMKVLDDRFSRKIEWWTKKSDTQNDKIKEYQLPFDVKEFKKSFALMVVLLEEPLGDEKVDVREKLLKKGGLV